MDFYVIWNPFAVPFYCSTDYWNGQYWIPKLKIYSCFYFLYVITFLICGSSPGSILIAWSALLCRIHFMVHIIELLLFAIRC